MFIYLHITQVEFVSAVLGTEMVVAASFLVIVAGCLLFLLAVFGIIIAIVDRLTPYAVVCYVIITNSYQYIYICKYDAKCFFIFAWFY